MSSKQYELKNTNFTCKYSTLAKTNNYSCPPETNYKIYKDINGGSNCLCPNLERSKFDMIQRKSFGRKIPLPPVSNKKLGW